MLNFDIKDLKPKVQEFLSREIPLYIDGNYTKAINNNTFEVIDPSTEDFVANVSEAGGKDIDKAVEAARKAFDEGS